MDTFNIFLAHSVFEKLHWLPVNNIYFEILLYVYKCLNGHAPDYLARCLSQYSQCRPGLCSALDTTRLAQPNISSKSLWSTANNAFSLAAPALWNQPLPFVHPTRFIHLKRHSNHIFILSSFPHACLI